MKWIGWLLRLSLTIMMVSILTIMTTGYVVNSYIQSLLSNYNLPISSETPSFGGMVKGMLGFSDTGQKHSNKKDQGEGVSDSNAPEDALPVMGSTSSDAASGSMGTDNDAVAQGAANQGQDMLGAQSLGTEQQGLSQQEQQAGQNQQQDQVLVTPDELVAKKDEIADKDKEEVFTILMSKLPQAEMQKLTEAMEDGLTEAELIEIEQILSKYLDKTEYSKMMNLLKE
ncbi:hypothetical protein D3C76_46570 [compost metagenome]